MKQLQCNFTTIEQSKRLLELGLPADSADCYNVIDSDVYNKDDIRVRQNDYEISYSFFNNKHYNPCWSVGRLIEIYHICVSRGFSFNVCFPNLMNEVMYKLREANNNGWLNLKKLEE